MMKEKGEYIGNGQNDKLSLIHIFLTKLFEETDKESAQGEINAQRIDIQARYQGTQIPFVQLPQYLQEDIAELEDLIKAGDRELFEDILANTVSRKIRGKINASNAWVDKMNHLMSGMNKMCIRDRCNPFHDRRKAKGSGRVDCMAEKRLEENKRIGKRWKDRFCGTSGH